MDVCRLPPDLEEPPAGSFEVMDWTRQRLEKTKDTPLLGISCIRRRRVSPRLRPPLSEHRHSHRSASSTRLQRGSLLSSSICGSGYAPPCPIKQQAPGAECNSPAKAVIAERGRLAQHMT